MDLELRFLRDDEFDDWYRANECAFGTHVVDSVLPLIRPARDINRTLVALDEGKIVGGTTAHSATMTVPGGTLPCAVVDDVAVLPTHRRRGILTMLMEEQFQEIHQHEEPLAALSASESSIYERFGYGNGALREDWSIERRHTRFAISPEIKGRTRFTGPDEIREVSLDIERRAYSDRPGFVPMKPGILDFYLADVEHERRGGSAYFHVVYEEEGRIDGLVIYRIRNRNVVVEWLVGVTPWAEAALWQYCFGIDLMNSIEAVARPLDDPLPWMLAETRHLKRTVRDAMWLRLVDVPATLSARRYAGDGSLVLEVHDKFCPWNQGKLALQVDGGKAFCKNTDRSPDLVLTASELACAYLGASTFSGLARAGRIQERKTGALAHADAMFATYIQPWTPGF